eukprot:ANDGO_03722.mRNA.1 Small nuclear ribonucleoprotein SmD3b
MSAIGVPIKLLHEATGHVVTVELITGEVYRGLLSDAEDSMNVHLHNVTYTGRDGRASHLEQVFLRGSKVRYVIVPDVLRNSPMLNRAETEKPVKGKGVGYAIDATKLKATVKEGMQSSSRRPHQASGQGRGYNENRR